ncbi:MAG: hypothetical protein OEY64_11555 [Nitrospinota bacterium]|nr:hypothetical protein [Nitrospinota bacterium]
MSYAFDKVIEKYLADGKAILLINVCIVLLLSWATSLWINSFISGMFFHLPQYDPKSVKPVSSGGSAMLDYSVIAKKNIFNPGSEPPPRGTALKATEEDLSGAVPSTLNLELLGTIITSIPQDNMAVIAAAAGKEQKLYKIADIVAPDAKIIRIDRFAVYIEKGGRVEALTLNMKEGFPTQRKAAADNGSGRPSGVDGLKGVGANQWVMGREFLKDQLNNMSALMTQVRAVPNMTSDGKIDGFKLFQIQKGSLYEKIGLQNQDVLKRINGQVLDSPEKGLELFNALKSETSFKLDIERNNSIKSMTIDVQ